MSGITLQSALVLLVLGATILLFITEKFRVDVIAIIVMLVLPWLGLVTPSEAFAGFSSNAVMSIIAVMIMGAGMDRTGMMNYVAARITDISGENENRLLIVVSAIVGAVSSFMQNVGSIALFLPAVLRICRQKNISPSKLMMPIGFAAILGGTLTMVGSGPLIILNDLLRSGGYSPFKLFDVTPVGAVLLTSGIIYFIVLGRFVLPGGGKDGENLSSQMKLVNGRNVPHIIYRCIVKNESSLVGKSREEINLRDEYDLYVTRVKDGDEIIHAPWRRRSFKAGDKLFILGGLDQVERFSKDYDLSLTSREGEDIFSSGEYGFAEMMVIPGSSFSGRTLREIAMRKNWGVEPLELINADGSVHLHFPDITLNVGDEIIVEGPWNNLEKLSRREDMISLTPLQKNLRKEKTLPAILCFSFAILLALSGFRLSLSLLTGALGMILSGVIRIDEAYNSIDWRTVFLLAGLIPLGTAMEKSGAASLVAGGMLGILADGHPFLILLVTGLMATLFSLFMSNVAATVLLVPLVMIMGNGVGVDPRGLALLVGVCASNSFILPTHQVNAMLMSRGGYRNSDYLKAGGIMSIIFLFISASLVYLFFV